MNRKAIYGILVVLILPLVAYFLLKSYTDRDVPRAPHYLADSTFVTQKDGKEYNDTIWHQLADFNLTNQLGEKVSGKDLEGKILVANFFFTHCPTICPTLTRNMKDLQNSVHTSEKLGDREADFIQFLSFSIDPERDTVDRLKWWADRFQVDPKNWWLLTGDKKTIYDLSVKELRVPAEDGGLIDSNFAHTDIFVLLDKKHQVRGYYHTVLTDTVNGGYLPDSVSLAKLSKDIIFLYLEKDPNKKFFLAGKLPLIAIVFVLLMLGLVLFYQFLKKEKNGYSHQEK